MSGAAPTPLRTPPEVVDGGEGRTAFTPAALRAQGFQGFVTFEELRDGALEEVPRRAGAYLVLTSGHLTPCFLETSGGGWFKGRDPSVSRCELERKWVAGAPCLYIGKADDLRRRLRQYASFGAGHPVGHWGGRYIWQLADADSLLIAWREVAPGESSLRAEAALVGVFKREYGGRLPYANLVDPSR
jgi:hypothetical protein